jgi:2-polyprenyl-6-methoxyphenol hydroxylase-like FAD-dependent oxidoreductase
MYTSLGEVPRIMLPKYPHHIQTGLSLPAGQWRQWREAGIATVAERVRRLDPIFADFAERLDDFKPFVPLEGHITLVKEWARDGMLLIGDAAHTMSPASAIGVNVALATAATAAQVLYPLLGQGPIARQDLAMVQHLREGDVRTLHRVQLRAQRILLAQTGQNPIVNWLLPKVLPLLVHSPLIPRMPRRMFVGVSLPPLDPAFGFRA